jgi:hypothetical protein
LKAASKQYKGHTGGSRYPVMFEVRHYWFELDSGLLDSGLLDSSQARNDEIHSVFWPDQ